MFDAEDVKLTADLRSKILLGHKETIEGISENVIETLRKKVGVVWERHQ